MTPARNFPELGVRQITSWGKWGHCSRCHKVGIQTRYGTCFLKATNVEQPGPGPLVALLGFNKTGLPCSTGASFLPHYTVNQTSFQVRRFCRVPCDRHHYVFWQHINDSFIQSATVLARGEEGLLVPRLPARVVKVTLKRTENLRLSCPGAPTSKLATWVKGQMPLKDIVDMQGRWVVTDLGELELLHTMDPDAGPYACYKGKSSRPLAVYLVQKPPIWQGQLHKFLHTVLRVVGMFVCLILLAFVIWQSYHRTHTL